MLPASVHELSVITRRGHALVVTLGVIACIVLVAAGVTIFMGAPPEIEGWKWPMTIGGLVALAAAFAVHRTRRRTLRITRTDDGAHQLVIEREQIHLTFPLGISGDQHENNVNGVPMYEVYLKLVDANQRSGVFFVETRGTIHGPQSGWLKGVDRAVSCERFEAGKVGQLAQLRAMVEAINARL